MFAIELQELGKIEEAMKEYHKLFSEYDPSEHTIMPWTSSSGNGLDLRNKQTGKTIKVLQEADAASHYYG
jgi:hypothetical protein